MPFLITDSVNTAQETVNQLMSELW